MWKYLATRHIGVFYRFGIIHSSKVAAFHKIASMQFKIFTEHTFNMPGTGKLGLYVLFASFFVIVTF